MQKPYILGGEVQFILKQKKKCPQLINYSKNLEIIIIKLCESCIFNLSHTRSYGSSSIKNINEYLVELKNLCDYEFEIILIRALSETFICLHLQQI